MKKKKQPDRKEPRARTVLLRAHVSEEDFWKEAARKRGLSLSQFLRKLANQASGHDLIMGDL